MKTAVTASRLGSTAVVVLLMAACEAPPPCGLRVCDIRDVPCQQDTFQATACLRGVPAAEIPVKVITRQAYMIAAAHDAATDDSRAQVGAQWNAALALLKLAPANIAPAEVAAQDSAWVGAWYSNEDKAITIIDDGQPMDSLYAVAMLAHEFTHGLQDVALDFTSWDARFATDFDSSQATASIAEGEASLVEDLVRLGLFGTAPDDIHWDQVFADYRQSSRQESYRSPLPVALAPLHFRYPFGGSMVTGAWRTGGWPAVTALREQPPLSTRQVLAAADAAGPIAPEESLAAVAVPALSQRFALFGIDRLGAWILENFLSRQKLTDAPRFARSLTGDALSVHFDQATGQPFVTWRMRFADEDAAHALASRLACQGPWTAYVVGRDLILVASPDPLLRDTLPEFRAVPAVATAAPAAMNARLRCQRRAP